MGDDTWERRRRRLDEDPWERCRRMDKKEEELGLVEIARAKK